MGCKKVPHFPSVFLLKTSRSQMIRALAGPGLEGAEQQGIIQYTLLCAISQKECLVSAEGSSGCRSHTGAGIQAKNSAAKGNSLGAEWYQNQFTQRAHHSSTGKVRICQNKWGWKEVELNFASPQVAHNSCGPQPAPVNESSPSGLLV